MKNLVTTIKKERFSDNTMIGEKASDSGWFLRYWLVPISNYKVSELFLCCSLRMIFALNYML